MTWPTKKLGEVLKYEQPQKYIVDSTEYSDEFEIPVLTPGKSFIRGYTNEKNNIFPAEKLPVIIFDDFTTATKFVDFPFKVKSSAMKILHAKKDEADIRYLFYLMQTIEINHTTHKRYWISEYSKIEIPLPPLEVQKKIVAKLENLLAKINEAKKLRAEARESADNLLSAELHKIFEEGKNKGWEEKELGSVASFVRGVTYKKSDESSNNSGIAVLRANNINLETNSLDLNKIKYLRGDLEFSDAQRIKAGDVFICIASGSTTHLGKIAYIGEDTEYFFGGFMGVIRSMNTKRLLPRFIYWNFVSGDFRNHMWVHGRGVNINNLRTSDLLAYKIPLPPFTEQKKIVARLDSISQKIEAVKELQNTTENEFSALESSVLSKAFNG